MDNTTTWIMVALLLLLIAAAVFVLLRRPGGDRDTALEDQDAPAQDRAVTEEPVVEPVVTEEPAAVEARGAVPEPTGADRAAAEDRAATEDQRPTERDDEIRDPGVVQAAGVVTETDDRMAAAGPVRDQQTADERRADELAGRPVEQRADQEAGPPVLREARTVAEEPREHPVEPASTTYRAEQGEALTVDEEGQLAYVDEQQTGRPGVDEPEVDRSDTDATAGVERPAAAVSTPYAADRDDDLATEEGQLGYVDEQQVNYPESGAPVQQDVRTADAQRMSATRADGRAEATRADDLGTQDTETEAPVFAESVYGTGSAEPLEDGSGPAGWEIKGNTGSMLFHTPESPSYDGIRAEVWFENEEAARASGFAHWDRRRR